jgi:hypothetical protein
MTRSELLILLLSICIIFSLFGNTHAGSAKEQYELQKRCGIRAEEYFMKKYGKHFWEDEHAFFSANYRNHYNKKLNKCFVLIIATKAPKRTDYEPVIVKTLWDINEMKKYGEIKRWMGKVQPSACEVLGKYCNCLSDWESLVRPYIEE